MHARRVVQPAGFFGAGEHGSVSSASRLLGLSQPALSRRLLRLEEELEVPLFSRSPRGLQLTAAGERVLAVAKRMREVADEVEEAAGQGHDPVGGVVRISAPEAGLGTGWLPRVLLPLRREHPDLILEIHIEVGRRSGARSLRHRDPRPTPGRPGAHGSTGGQDRVGALASGTYLERSPSPATPASSPSTIC